MLDENVYSLFKIKVLHIIVPGPTREPSIVKWASTPVMALAKPFPVKTTF